MDSLTRRVGAHERHLKALELRKAGATYAAIAEQLGYASPEGARKAVSSALKATLRDSADELRQLEQERLDALLLGLWRRAASGDEKAARVALGVSKRRSELLGLDRKPRPEPEEEGELACPARASITVTEIAAAMDALYARYRGGLIDAGQARAELSILSGQLKAAELVVISEKLERIEAALSGRRS
jgi:hypothetical protein